MNTAMNADKIQSGYGRIDGNISQRTFNIYLKQIRKKEMKEKTFITVEN